MELKTLSFDSERKPGYKALIIHNIKTTWPIWASMLFLLSWLIPVSFSFENLLFNKTLISYSIPYGVAKFIAIPVCILMAMRVFGYLFKERSTIFFHSLPYTRTMLFCVNALSGYFLIIIPLFFVGFTTVIISAASGNNMLNYMTEWFLVLCCECFYVYSFTVLMAVIMGTKISGYVMTGIMFIYTVIIVNIYSTMFSNIHPSVNNDFFTLAGEKLMFLSPITTVLNIYVSADKFSLLKNNENVSGGNLERGYVFNNLDITIKEELIIGALMIIAAFLLYRYRKSEKSGEIIAFNSFRMFFKWGFSLSFGAFLSQFLGVAIMSNMEDQLSVNIFQTCLYIFFVLLSYLIAEMIVSKKFNVFYKLRIEILFPLAASVLIALLILFDGFGITRYVPDKNDIEYVNFDVYLMTDGDKYETSSGKYNTHYYINFDEKNKYLEEKNIDKVLELHKAITDAGPDKLSSKMSGYSKYSLKEKTSVNDVYVDFYYGFNDESKINRRYCVPFSFVKDYLQYFDTYGLK